MSDQYEEYSCHEWYLWKASQVQESRLCLKLGSICPEESHVSALQSLDHYCGKTVLDEWLANSNAALAQLIAMWIGAKHLNVPWSVLKNVFIYSDDGTGIGSSVSDKEDEITKARFLSFGSCKDNPLHSHDLGRYGKGNVLNAQALCSSYLVISRHKTDIANSTYFVCVKSFVSKRVHCTVQVGLKGNGGLFFEGCNGDDFQKWLELWTPVRLDHLQSLIEQLFNEKRSTGVSMICFGMKQKVKKESIEKRFSELYWEPPQDDNGKAIDNFTVTYNDDKIPIVYAQDKFDMVHETIKKQQAISTNGFYPTKPGDTTWPRKVHQDETVLLSANGTPLIYDVAVVRSKEPLFDPNPKDGQPRKPFGTVVFVCGNQVININLADIASVWKGQQYQILLDVFRSKKQSTSMFRKLSQYCDAKSEVHWHMSKLGYEVTFVVWIPPWLLEVTKKRFVKSSLKLVSKLLLSCLKTNIPYLCEYSHHIADTSPFKYMWKIGDRVFTAEMFSKCRRTEGGTACVPYASREKYVKDPTTGAFIKNKKSNNITLDEEEPVCCVGKKTMATKTTNGSQGASSSSSSPPAKRQKKQKERHVTASIITDEGFGHIYLYTLANSEDWKDAEGRTIYKWGHTKKDEVGNYIKESHRSRHPTKSIRVVCSWSHVPLVRSVEKYLLTQGQCSDKVFKYNTGATCTSEFISTTLDENELIKWVENKMTKCLQKTLCNPNIRLLDYDVLSNFEVRFY